MANILPEKILRRQKAHRMNHLFIYVRHLRHFKRGKDVQENHVCYVWVECWEIFLWSGGLFRRAFWDLVNILWITWEMIKIHLYASKMNENHSLSTCGLLWVLAPLIREFLNNCGSRREHLAVSVILYIFFIIIISIVIILLNWAPVLLRLKFLKAPGVWIMRDKELSSYRNLRAISFFALMLWG